MSETEGEFRLTFVQGRGLLTLAGRDFPGVGRVDSLELEIPNLSFPFDLSGGITRFKNRRLRLRELALAVGSDELTGCLARAPLGDFGIFDPHVVVEGSRLTLTVRVRLGGRDIELTAAAVLAPLPPRGASLCVYDVRAFGFLPVPAPLVITALFSALGAETPANRESAVDFALPALVHIYTAADIRIDACDLAMLGLLPMYGWRLPDRSQVKIRVAGGAAKSNHVPLVFSLEDAAAAPDPLLDGDANPEAYPMRDFTARCGHIEDALARGDIATALGQLRALSPLEAEDRVGTARLLQLLLAGQSTLDEAQDVAQAALVHWPEFVPGILALAVVSAERGQAIEAAAFYEEVAQLAVAQGRSEDGSCALLAAARQLVAAGQHDQALLTLERALVMRPSLSPVARAKVMRRAAEGGWGDILAIIGEEASLAQPDVSDEVAQVLDLVYQGQREHDPVLLGQAVGFLETLLAREEWPAETSHPRAEAAYQLGLAYAALEDDEAASGWLAACIEGEVSGPVAAEAWRALAELMLRRGDSEGAVQALAGWAGDSRVPEDAGEKTRHLLEAAEICRQKLRDPEQALSWLESALSLAATDEQVLGALERLSRETRIAGAVVSVLRRHLGDLRPDQGKTVLRALVRVQVENTRQHEEAKEACRVLLGLAPDDEEATLYLARMAWEAGDRAAAAPGYLHLAAREGLPSAVLGEVRLRQAQIARGEGRHSEARQYLEQGVMCEPDGAVVEVLVEALREFGQEERLAGILVVREATFADDIDRQHARRRLARLAERRGDLAEAEAIYRGLLDANPDDVELLDCMASLCKRQGRGDDLLLWLGKLWEAVEREGLSEDGAIDGMAVGRDFAALLARDPAGWPRAETVLRRLLEKAPESRELLDKLDALLVEQGAFEEAGKIFSRRLALVPEAEAGALLVARARQCAARPDGLRAALAVLQTLEPEELDEEALSLRVETAQSAGNLHDAALCLERLRGQATAEEARVALTRRLAEVASQPGLPADEAIALLEQLLAEDPDNLFVAKALFEAYGRLEDATSRTQAWQELLAKEPALPDVYRGRLHMALAEMAEREGDLQAAEELIDKAAKLDRSPKARLEQLVAHARLLLLRDETKQAEADVAEAVTLNAELPGVLALVAELAYRAQDWEKARASYMKLAALPEAASVVSPATLAGRRAELAEMFGDHAEAEAAYRQVAAVAPQNDSAREALAGFALSRGDLAEAALHLQEVARILPKEAVVRLTQVRQRLGQVFLGLGDLQAARQSLELTLASEPDRASTLELLTTTYTRLGLHRDAATMCERLSRVLTDPPRKAEALFRKGEILRVSLADPEGASEAYLRASDLDPSYSPPLGRLVTYYWDCAEMGKLADVGGDLVQASPTPRLVENDLGLLVTIAALLDHHDEALAKLALESLMLGAPLRADVAAGRLGELVARVARGSFDALDAVLGFVFSSMPATFESELLAALLQAVASDPGDAGQAMVLGRLFERRGAPVLARSAYSLAHFLDGGVGADKRLAELGEASPPKLGALAPDAAVHHLCRGPLRRVLHHLAAARASAGPAAYDEPAAPLQPETLALCESLRVPMNAPAVPLVAQGHGADVTFSASQPLCILIGRRAESLPSTDLRFLLGRALEQARAGTLAVLRMSADNLRGMLRAVLRVAGAPGTPFELAEEAADEPTALWLSRLRKPEISALIPLAERKGELLADAAAALVNPPELDEYIRGCRYTADRVGLLLCGRPITALRALAGQLKDGGVAEEALTTSQKREQLRASPAARELCAFMVSAEYASLVEGG
jgi:tetratricopeptide (TPR) repeat protein